MAIVVNLNLRRHSQKYWQATELELYRAEHFRNVWTKLKFPFRSILVWFRVKTFRNDVISSIRWPHFKAFPFWDLRFSFNFWFGSNQTLSQPDQLFLTCNKQVRSNTKVSGHQLQSLQISNKFMIKNLYIFETNWMTAFCRGSSVCFGIGWTIQRFSFEHPCHRTSFVWIFVEQHLESINWSH